MKKLFLCMILIVFFVACEEDSLVDPYDETEELTVTITPNPVSIRQIGIGFRTDNLNIEISDATNVLWFYSYDVVFRRTNGQDIMTLTDLSIPNPEGAGAGNTTTTYFGVYDQLIKMVTDGGETEFQGEIRFKCARTNRYAKPVTLNYTIVQ